jgi:hypothetical protein
MKSDVLTLKTAIPAEILKLTQPKLSVQVEVVDNGNPPYKFTKTLLIGVAHTERKPFITIEPTTILENSAVNSVVAKFDLKNMREDVGGYVISLVDAGGLPFKVVGKDLILTEALNYAILNAYTIKVSVSYKKYTYDVIKTSFNLLVIQTNICQPKCNENAACEKAAGSPAVCKCKPGFVKSSSNGGSCVDEDDCKKYNPPCLNGGTCKDGEGEFECTCPKEYGGERCQVELEPPKVCSTNPCKNKGVCSKVGSEGYRCECKPGLEGKNCETNINDCVIKKVKCLFGGVCKDLINDYECSCPKDKFGCNCGFDKNACDSANCSGEICVPKYNAAGNLCAPKSARSVLRVKKGSLSSEELRHKLCKLFNVIKQRLFSRLDTIPPGKTIEDMPVLRVYTSKIDLSSKGEHSVLEYVIFNDEGKIYTEKDVIDAMQQSCTNGKLSSTDYVSKQHILPTANISIQGLQSNLLSRSRNNLGSYDVLRTLLAD